VKEEIEMERKAFGLGILMVLIFFPAQGLAQDRPALVDDMGYADTILINGKIVTMDDRGITPNTPGHIHEAMAIKGKRIMALGSTQEMRQLAGPKTRTVDVGGKTVIPGLVHTHYHIFSSAATEYGPSQGLVDPSVKVTVFADPTAEGTAKKVRDTVVNAIQVQKIPPGQWITVDLQESKGMPRGITYTWLYLGKINRRQIDGGTEKHPVLVTTGLHGILNSTAIQEFKKVFPEWEESTDMENRPGAARDGYVAVPELGGLTFEFWWKDKPLENLAETLRLKGVDVIGKGITTVATRILYPRVIAAFNLLNRQGRMPHRLAYFIESQRGNFFGLQSIYQFYKATGAPWTNHANGGEMLWLNGMCNEIWDSIFNEICMGPDVSAPEEIKMRERCPAPGTKPWEAVKAGIINGWRPAQVHATSSHGARLYIQMLEEAMKEANYSVEYMRSLRTTIEHAHLLGTPPDVMEGIKKYGIIVNVTPFILPTAIDNIKDYGEQLRPYVMPVKTWINQGIRVTFEAGRDGRNGTDFWTPIYQLVTRKISGQNPITGELSGETEILLPEEAIDRVTALKMATTWASEYMMAEDTVGTLEPGKFADFAVLDRDFFTIEIEEILDTTVVMTGLSGQIVFDAENMASGN
jgi:predicted amidohydrolase YtcJ